RSSPTRRRRSAAGGRHDATAAPASVAEPAGSRVRGLKGGLTAMRRPSALVLAICVLLIAMLAEWPLLAPVEVRVAHPTSGPAFEAVYATGTVEPTLEIRIAPQMAGRIVELKVDEGDTVRKGQLLARLEDADLLAAVAELEARVEYARA